MLLCVCECVCLHKCHMLIIQGMFNIHRLIEMDDIRAQEVLCLSLRVSHTPPPPADRRTDSWVDWRVRICGCKRDIDNVAYRCRIMLPVNIYSILLTWILDDPTVLSVCKWPLTRDM